MKRRDMIRGTAGMAGMLAGGFGAGLLPSVNAAGATTGGPKRIIFFLQNQGFSPSTCVPKGVQGNHSLAKLTLPDPISPLEPYKERMHVINGLHGLHTSPMHSAFFGALGGYRGGFGVAASGKTIDCAISEALPQTVMPHLGIGMGDLDAMETAPTIATLSATAANKPVHMYSHPMHLYEKLFGAIATGDMRTKREARTAVRQRLEQLTRQQGIGLPPADKMRYDGYVDGFREMNGLTTKLNGMSDHLRKFAPSIDDRFTRPEFETDWHDALLEIGIAALASGITNTLTIGSGRGTIHGSWKGLGVETVGHRLGHMGQMTDMWIKIRQYNCQMLVKLMEALEKVPEGKGTMMDNTLIVYTSNNADAQHSNGKNWPVILLGNYDGRIKTGRLTQLEEKRPINAFYATLLQATTGKSVARFNMTDKMATKYDSGSGAIGEILV